MQTSRGKSRIYVLTLKPYLGLCLIINRMYVLTLCYCVYRGLSVRWSVKRRDQNTSSAHVRRLREWRGP